MIMLALVDGKPKICNLKDMLVEYLKHQKEVVTRRTIYDKLSVYWDPFLPCNSLYLLKKVFKLIGHKFRQLYLYSICTSEPDVRFGNSPLITLKGNFAVF